MMAAFEEALNYMPPQACCDLVHTTNSISKRPKFFTPHKPVITVKVEHPVIVLSDDSSDADTQDFDAPSSRFKLRKLPTVQHPVDAVASTLSSFSNFHFVFHEVPVREKKRTLRTPEGIGHPQVTLCIQGSAQFEGKLLLIKWTHVKDFYNVTQDCVEFLAYAHDHHPDLLKFVTNLAALKFQGHFNLNTPLRPLTRITPRCCENMPISV